MDVMKKEVQFVLSNLLRRSFHCDERSSGTFNWAHYVSILSTASSLEECEEAVDSLLDGLLHHDCEDLVLSTTLIDFIAVYRNYRYFGEETVWGAAALAAGCASFLSACVYDSDFDLETHEATFFPAYGYDSDSKKKRKQIYQANANEFLWALRRSDVKLLKLLVKYGVSVRGVSKEHKLDEIRRSVRGFCRFGYRRSFIVSWVNSSTSYMHLTATTRNHTRLMEVLLGIEAVKRKKSGDATHREYAECVRIYFRDVPSKFISASEVRVILEKLQCTPLGIESWCRDFSELFPEFPNEPRTRSLMDMCRATVRYSLTYKNNQRTKTLPLAVSDLCFPRRLKGYLLGQE